VANGSTGVTTGGDTFTINGPGSGFQVLQQDVTWLGNFPNNTPVLFDGYGSGPVTIDFNTPISNISKLAIESNYYGSFVATLLAYDGLTLVGTETVNGVSAYSPNTAPAFDFSSPEITSLVISTTNDGVGFGLGGVGGSAATLARSRAFDLGDDVARFRGAQLCRLSSDETERQLGLCGVSRAIRIESCTEPEGRPRHLFEN